MEYLAIFLVLYPFTYLSFRSFFDRIHHIGFWGTSIISLSVVFGLDISTFANNISHGIIAIPNIVLLAMEVGMWLYMVYPIFKSDSTHSNILDDDF